MASAPATVHFEPTKPSNTTIHRFSATELIEGGGAFPDQPGQSLTYKNTVTAGGVNGKVIGFINGYFIVTAAATKTEEAWFQQTQTVVFTAGPHAGSTITIAGAYAFAANPPLSIVGGTGQFAGANGVYFAGPNPDSEHAAELNFIFTTEKKLHEGKPAN
jgi:hypothetical protein